jgi:dCTP deaminase
MSYLGTDRVNQLIASRKVIDPAPCTVSCGASELSLGEEIFRTDSPDKKKEFLKQEKEQVVINPGQFALLLTKECVNIPSDKIAFISIKAGIKLKGLINVSGFHVDPGFKGNLVFSVYNAGSSQISLAKGEPCFLLWFAELNLTESETDNYQTGNHDHKGQNSIPTRYIDSLLAGELASPNVLSKRIEDYQKELDARIRVIEKEHTAKDYLIKTAIGLGLVLVLKLGFDWAAYDNGFRKGYFSKQKEISADSAINQLLVQKRNLLTEIDSLKSRLKTP